MRRWLLGGLAYLVLGGAGIAAVAWWRMPAATPPLPAVDGSFAYPTVIAPAGRNSADWRAGHLDGWKWALQHASDNELAEDAQLGGYLVGSPDRDGGFLRGYALARAHVLHAADAQGVEATQRIISQLRRRQPALYDVGFAAPPPP